MATFTHTPTRTPTTIPGIYLPGEAVQVTTDLILRAGTGTSNPVIDVMLRGTTGTVTGAPQLVGSAIWYPNDMDGFGEGWAVGTYLTNIITAALEPTDAPTEVPSTASPEELGETLPRTRHYQSATMKPSAA